jgi:hypothetical protein
VLLLAGVGPGSLRGQEEPPPVPKGVEVLARGPVHEAFATLATEAAPSLTVPKAPPKPLEELPPEEKPEGDSIWISGYWAWDDERSDYLWVSGIWRTPPPGKRWVAGYWREEGSKWQWVPGFWTVDEQKQDAPQQVTYMPQPPAPPEVADPGRPPTEDSFYVPGYYVWRGDGYAWRAGYWARVQPGYVWVPAHYRWTPGGYVFIPGYWDLAVARRGVLYAPVIVDTTVVGATFVYTPYYAVHDDMVIDAMFVRPCCCHYYFGDYYGPAYHDLGYESCVVYSTRHYDAIFVYERYEHRSEPNWVNIQISLYSDRAAGRAPVPPRTLVQQQNIVVNNVTNVTNVNNVNNMNNVNNTTINRTNINQTNVTQNNINHTTVNKMQMLAPARQTVAAKGGKTVPLDNTARVQAKQQAQAVQQQVAQQRQQAEVQPAGGKLTQPRTAALNVPRQQPAGSNPIASTRPQGGATPSGPGNVRPATFNTPGSNHAGPAARPGSPGPGPAAGSQHPAGSPVPPSGVTDPWRRPTTPQTVRPSGVPSGQPPRPMNGTRPPPPSRPGNSPPPPPKKPPQQQGNNQ